MIPFAFHKKIYFTKKTLQDVEAKFSEIEENPAKFYNEINAKRLSASLKKYRFYVAPSARSGVNTIFTFTRTVMAVRLFEENGNTVIITVIKTNPLYLLLLILSVSGLMVHFFSGGPVTGFSNSMPYVFGIVAAVVVDHISKKILSATFERFI